jgi:hypothetical protein
VAGAGRPGPRRGWGGGRREGGPRPDRSSRSGGLESGRRVRLASRGRGAGGRPGWREGLTGCGGGRPGRGVGGWPGLGERLTWPPGPGRAGGGGVRLAAWGRRPGRWVWRALGWGGWPGRRPSGGGTRLDVRRRAGGGGGRGDRRIERWLAGDGEPRSRDRLRRLSRGRLGRGGRRWPGAGGTRWAGRRSGWHGGGVGPTGGRWGQGSGWGRGDTRLDPGIRSQPGWWGGSGRARRWVRRGARWSRGVGRGTRSPRWRGGGDGSSGRSVGRGTGLSRWRGGGGARLSRWSVGRGAGRAGWELRRARLTGRGGWARRRGGRIRPLARGGQRWGGSRWDRPWSRGRVRRWRCGGGGVGRSGWLSWSSRRGGGSV